MCGRYSLVTDYDTLQTRFDIKNERRLQILPRYNIAPTQEIAVITNSLQGNQLTTMKWGLIPPWATSPSLGTRMINARAETLLERRSFKSAFLHRRCLIPADGFYEWMPAAPKRIPMRITLPNTNLFAFAGLWEAWHNPTTGTWIKSCSVITTSANDLMKPIHNRMPVILKPTNEASWIDSSTEDAGTLQQLLQPYDQTEMDAYEVATLVNSPRNDTVDCIARIS